MVSLGVSREIVYLLLNWLGMSVGYYFFGWLYVIERKQSNQVFFKK